MTSLSEALAPKSDQLNADDLIAGPRTLEITSAKIVRSERQMRITLGYKGDNGKPFKPCKTMGRAMVMVWGITDDNYEQQFVGKSIRVYRDPEVKFGDQGAVGGIRISHMSHITKATTVKLTVSQGKKSNFVFQPLPGVVQGEQLTPAQKWARGYVGTVNAAADLAALNAFANEKAVKLAELQSASPELHTECVHALDMRRQALSFADGSTDAEIEDAQEGPATEDRGEAFNDDGGFAGEEN